MPLRPIYYDTETTGIRSDKDRIVELAAYDPEKNATFVEFINPGMPIPSEASAIHGITDEMVANAGNFGVVIQQFIQFCEGEVVLIAHNNDAFDQVFLKAEFQRNSVEFPTQWKFLDSLKWSRKYRKDLPKHQLQFLREVYGIEANTAHRALDDVIVLHKVFTYMLDDLTIDTAMQLLAEVKELKHMPFGKHQGVPLSEVPSSYVKWLAENGALDKDENKQLKESFSKLGLLQAIA